MACVYRSHLPTWLRRRSPTLKSGRIWSRPLSLGYVAWTLGFHLLQPWPHLPIGTEEMEKGVACAWHCAKHAVSFFLKVQPQGPNPGPVCWSEEAGWPQIPATGRGTITPALLSVPFQGELGLPGAPGIDGEKVSGPFGSLVMLCLMLCR